MPDLAHVKCGECDIPLNVKGRGCKICNPVKESMVVPSLSEFGDTSLGTMVYQQLRMLRVLTDRLENEIYSMHPKDSKSKNPNRWKWDRDHQRAGIELMKAAQVMLAEARKFEAAEAEKVENMSHAEKLELIAAMVDQMPGDLKQELMNRVTLMLAPPSDAEITE